ncbi:hypothetical protein PUN28_007815 [Cardiocondyla obscurior]|uniref:C3H1-type domain-containing protein n=1 Tax=Cardiocondyla obscurior TaxID=286306 RepID=A0AAW2FZK1_9HYME
MSTNVLLNRVSIIISFGSISTLVLTSDNFLVHVGQMYVRTGGCFPVYFRQTLAFCDLIKKEKFIIKVTINIINCNKFRKQFTVCIKCSAGQKCKRFHEVLIYQRKLLQMRKINHNSFMNIISGSEFCLRKN